MRMPLRGRSVMQRLGNNRVPGNEPELESLREGPDDE